MKNHEIPSAEERLPITSPDAMEQAIRDIEQQEQLYSIALFDILGFSNLVQNNGTQIVLDVLNASVANRIIVTPIIARATYTCTFSIGGILSFSFIVSIFTFLIQVITYTCPASIILVSPLFSVFSLVI